MRVDWLQAFLTFSQSMNFTRAAEMLNISQPALHVKIGKLAEWLGQPLYRKEGRNLVLTPIGERVSAYAREEQERFAAFMDELCGGMHCQPAALCAGSGAYLYLLGPAISQFTECAAYPLKLLTGDRDHTLKLVATGLADLGVTVLDEMPSGIAAEPLTEVDQILVMPRDHPLAKRRRIRLADLHDQALIVPPRNRPHRIMVSHMLMSAGVSWRVAVEANGWDLMLHFARLGVGLAIVNGCCRVPRGLVTRPLPDLPKIRYQIVTRIGAPSHAGAIALKELLLTNSDAWRRSTSHEC
jgi:DNA-binding transcriptional LysR family regulator